MGYSPNNATMVVVGDVTSDEIFSALREIHRADTDARAPPPVTTVEPEQLGEPPPSWFISRQSCRF